MVEVIIIAVVSVTVIGIICAAVLSAASKVMAVQVDERVEKVRQCLPGANCGACGYAGCDGYAKALVEDGVKTNLCVPGGDSVSKEISSVLGVEFEDVIEKVAVVRCQGDCTRTAKKMNYEGIDSCKGAKLLFGGDGSCVFGCLGFGDCAKVCPNDAICIEGGIARVDERACVGCALCASACPNNVIAIVPETSHMLVRCSNMEKGAAVRKECTMGCIGCKKCERVCPAGAISVANNLAGIDYEKCINCGACKEACPVGCIALRGVQICPAE